jgi:hypothetical protein
MKSGRARASRQRWPRLQQSSRDSLLGPHRRAASSRTAWTTSVLVRAFVRGPVAVAVVDVGVVRVSVGQRLVLVPVRMRLRGIGPGRVIVSMMVVVAVAVSVPHRGVLMVVAVVLGQMQVDAQGHEHASPDNGSGHRLVDERKRRDRPRNGAVEK